MPHLNVDFSHELSHVCVVDVHCFGVSIVASVVVVVSFGYSVGLLGGACLLGGGISHELR